MDMQPQKINPTLDFRIDATLRLASSKMARPIALPISRSCAACFGLCSVQDGTLAASASISSRLFIV